jgi:hypothetical protein
MLWHMQEYGLNRWEDEGGSSTATSIQEKTVDNPLLTRIKEHRKFLEGEIRAQRARLQEQVDYTERALPHQGKQINEASQRASAFGSRIFDDFTNRDLAARTGLRKALYDQSDAEKRIDRLYDDQRKISSKIRELTYELELCDKAEKLAQTEPTSSEQLLSQVLTELRTMTGMTASEFATFIHKNNLDITAKPIKNPKGVNVPFFSPVEITFLVGENTNSLDPLLRITAGLAQEKTPMVNGSIYGRPTLASAHVSMDEIKRQLDRNKYYISRLVSKSAA